MMLMRYAQMMRAQQAQQHGTVGGRQGRSSYFSNPSDPYSNNPMTPGSANLLHALYMDFLNKGGGFVGNDIVGGGQVFGGFNRGGSPVGNVNFLRGDAPWMGLSPNQSMERFFGPGRGSFGYPGQGTQADRPGLGEFFGNIGGMGGELQGGIPEYF